MENRSDRFELLGKYRRETDQRKVSCRHASRRWCSQEPTDPWLAMTCALRTFLALYREAYPLAAIHRYDLAARTHSGLLFLPQYLRMIRFRRNLRCRDCNLHQSKFYLVASCDELYPCCEYAPRHSQAGQCRCGMHFRVASLASWEDRSESHSLHIQLGSEG